MTAFARLTRAEMRRLLSRRLTRGALVAALSALAVAALITAGQSSKDTSAAWADARSKATMLAGRGDPVQRQALLASVDACRDLLARRPLADPHACHGPNGMPSPGVFYQDPRFVFATSQRHLIDTIVGVLIIVALTVSASGIGAEWSSGTFVGLLLFEARRLRVLAAKLTAATLVLVSAGVVLIVLDLFTGLALARTRGTFSGTDAQTFVSLAGRILRGLALIGLAGLLGGSVATIARGTAAAVGLLGGYLIGFEMLLATWLPPLQPWLLLTNGRALLAGSHRVYAGPQHAEVILRAGSAGIYATVLIACCVLVAAAALRFRDAA